MPKEDLECHPIFCIGICFHSMAKFFLHCKILQDRRKAGWYSKLHSELPSNSWHGSFILFRQSPILTIAEEKCTMQHMISSSRKSFPKCMIHAIVRPWFSSWHDAGSLSKGRMEILRCHTLRVSETRSSRQQPPNLSKNPGILRATPKRKHHMETIPFIPVDASTTPAITRKCIKNPSVSHGI